MIISVKDGKTPYIGSNGNWWIGSFDTGVYAQGGGGYGLGAETPVAVDDANTITRTGWYSSANNVPGGVESYGMHINLNDDFAVQEFRNYTGSNFARRLKVVGIWGDWMWDQPFMIPNKEYLTKELYAYSQSVYVKCLPLGNLPNNGTIQVAHNISALGAMISIEGHYGPDAYTGINLIGTPGISVTADTENITVHTTQDYSTHKAWVILKYTKEE